MSKIISCISLLLSYICHRNLVAPAAKNAPVYNLAGQQVGASYKGVVIKNGKKYVQK